MIVRCKRIVDQNIEPPLLTLYLIEKSFYLSVIAVVDAIGNSLSPAAVSAFAVS
jgi:hypothetical protein